MWILGSRRWYINSLHSSLISLSKIKLWFIIFSITSFSLNLGLFGLKGEYPWIISYNRTPKDHTSISFPYPSWLTNSGDIYSVVPQNVPLWWPSNFTHQPKSHNFTTLFSYIKIFSGFMSLWIKSFWCKKLTALTTCINNEKDLFSFNPLNFLI